MSLDKILFDLDTALLDVVSHVNGLLTVLTLFVPIFIVTFAILALLLIALLVLSISLQFKRLRAERRRRDLSLNPNRARSELPGEEESEGTESKKARLSPVTYRRVSSEAHISPSPTASAPRGGTSPSPSKPEASEAAFKQRTGLPLPPLPPQSVSLISGGGSHQQLREERRRMWMLGGTDVDGEGRQGETDWRRARAKMSC